MMAEPTSDTKAVLMLTAPLLAKTRASGESVKPLTPKEYRTLATWLRDEGMRPAELMERGSDKLIADFAAYKGRGSVKENRQRLCQLLDRGVELALAVERWTQRAIWVLSWYDPKYPELRQQPIGDDFPLLYGCGGPGLLGSGGLAVVGSRHASDEALKCAANAGRLAARADCTIVSGGARGSDQAAMRGTLEEGGSAVGVLANGLDRAVLHADHREMLMDERLVLVCPWDPGVRFQAWRAMQRNKLIYALADAALVAAYEPGKGGTWSGATEQLKLPQPMPVYVRCGEPDALLQKGAKPWPEPASPANLRELLRPPRARADASAEVEVAAREVVEPNPAEELWVTVRRVFGRMSREARTPEGIKEALDVTLQQARDWWTRLVRDTVLEVLEGEPSPRSAVEIAEAAGLPTSRRQLVVARLRAFAEEGLLQKKGAKPERYCLSEPESSPGASGRMAGAANSPTDGAGDRLLALPGILDTGNVSGRPGLHDADESQAVPVG